MWKVFLLLVGAVAYGATAESVLTDISRNLQLEMERVREMAKVNYSNPVINATYTSKSEFDMRAMGSLYNATHLVIDFIANKQAYPEGMVSVSDGHLEIAPLREHWRELLAHYAGPTAVIVVTVLVAASLPLAGVFWCCCYWCKSGRRRRAFDRKYDACIKGLLAILMIALLTLFLFGVVCAFATESQLEEGAEGAPEGVRASLTDARVFLAASHAHAKHLLVDNYAELERAIAGLITSTGMAVSVHVGQFSGAASVGTLNNLVQRLDGVQRDLRTVHNLTAQLRAHADHLNSGLRKVKGQLLRTLAQCEQPPCVRLQEKYKIGQLDTEIQYNQMPDVSGLLANVSGLLASNIREEVADGARVFRDIQRAVQRSVDDAVPVLRDSLRDTGAELERVSSELGTLAASGDDQLRAAGAAADRLQALHAAYGRYRRLAGLAAAAALLAVTCLLSLGVTCGVCGKRPDVYGASDCCNKGAGASCLLCGTGCMFLVGGAAAVVLLAYFVVGLTTQRFICDPLTSPRDSRLFSDVEKLVRLEQLWLGVQADPALRLGAVLERCHQNYTIYEVLQLQRAYDVERLAAEARRRLAARVARLRPAFNASVTLLRPSAKDKLRALADAGLSDFNFDRILQALETNLTSLSLPRLAEQLLSAADGVQERAGYARVAPDLRRAADELRRLQVAHAQPMAAAGAQLANVTTALRDGLRFNDLPLKEAVAYLVYETGQAELYLKKQGPELVHNLTQQWGGVVGELLVGYAARVGDGARLHVGRCQPLSAAFNGTRALACHHLLLPVNGFWLSISWCLLLFVPLMVTAQRLARLYRHVDPYPGPLVEAEYLYDAYADRDNVPLANTYKAEKRAGRGRAAGGGGGGCAGAGGAAGPGAGGAGGAGPALAPPLDAHHARRYNDMAPKHWEEGPPRYHGPTEYERPPPYYYPGPNDRQ